MKKMIKFASFILSLAILSSAFSVVFADATVITTLTGGDDPGLKKIASNVLGYVQFFGYAIAIGMLLYIGIKYMMASANEKADLKKGSINYVIGAVIVAGATAIVSIITGIGGSLATAEGTGGTNNHSEGSSKARVERNIQQGMLLED